MKVEGAILLDSSLFLTDTFTLIGLGPERSIIDGQDRCVPFDVGGEASLTLQQLTVAHGNAQGHPPITAENIPLSAGGAAIVFGELIADHCVFRDNVAIAGGAIFFHGSGGFSPIGKLINCSFYRNRADLPSPTGLYQAGGALYGDGLAGGNVSIEAINCTFSNNYAIRGGGALMTASVNEGVATFSCINCTITENESQRFAGGIDNSLAENIFLTNTILAGNRGPLGGEDILGTINSGGHNLIGNGALSFTPDPTDQLVADPQLGPLGDHGSPLLTHIPKCGSPALNQADDAFAPLQDLRGATRDAAPDIGSHERLPELDVRVLNLDDTGGNSLREALMVACPGDTLSLSGLSGVIHLTAPLTITQPIHVSGATTGGVVLDGDDSVRLMRVEVGGHFSATDLTLRDGFANAFGGGAVLNKGQLTLVRCAVIGSEAEAGGAIANYGDQDTAHLRLVNCTLSGNEAIDYAGGAIDNRGLDFGAYAELINCTVAENRSLFQGGGIFNDSDSYSRLYLINTLFALNQAEAGPDIYGAANSGGHNLIGSDQNLIMEAQAGDQLGVWADIDQLATWDGVTPTHRLRANSPAIDAGDNSVATITDQRGAPRIFNQTIDIGAYEYDPATNLTLHSPQRLSISVAPVPGRGPFTLRGLAQARVVAYRVMDQQGRVRQSGTLPVKEGQAALSLQAATQWSSGLYFLQVMRQDERAVIKLLLP